MGMAKLVVLRHGQSIWNAENRFTGWTDVDLTRTGEFEAQQAANQLGKDGFVFDAAYTSVLKRAIRTLWIVLERLDQMWLDAKHEWRLNERHYGALQGYDKAALAKEIGQEQVFAWRRSFETRPPLLDWEDPRHPRFDRRYAHIDPQLLPVGESLKDAQERVLACWKDEIQPKVLQGEDVLIVAHGNSLRALVKYIDGIPDEGVADLFLPTGIPLVYVFDEKMLVTEKRFLGDPEDLRKATEAFQQDMARMRKG